MLFDGEINYLNIPHLKENIILNRSTRQPHSVIVANELSSTGKLNKPVLLCSQSLAIELNTYIEQKVYQCAISELNWDKRLYIIIIDSKGQPVQSLVTDHGRYGFYQSIGIKKESGYYINKIYNKRYISASPDHRSEQKSFYYVIEARALIKKIEQLTRL